MSTAQNLGMVLAQLADLRAQLATLDKIEQELLTKAQRLTGELVDARAAKAKAERQNREHLEAIAILRGELARANGYTVPSGRL